MKYIIICLILLLVGCDKQNISPEQAYKMMENEDVVIIDVREYFEYNSGHLENAINIPLDDLEEKINEIDKDKKIIVYCLSGNRAQIALEILAENGYDNIYTFGGIKNWNYELYEY